MFKRMAIRAQYDKVFKVITLFIFVLMMHAQNFRMSIITAFYTVGNHIASFHCISNKAKCSCFTFLLGITETNAGTIFPFMRRGGSEFLMAELALLYNRAFEVLCFIITMAGAVFRFALSTSNISKILTTYLAFTNKLSLCRLPSTFRRAKPSRQLSIRSDTKWVPASLALESYIHT